MEKHCKYPEAQASKKNKKEIFQIAEEYAQTVKYQIGHDIEPVIKKLGGKIKYVNINEWLETQEGSICVNSKNDFIIYLPNFFGPLRDRFTLAHELGHYVLHSKFGKDKIKAARLGDSPVEIEANNFALAFLMPEEKFKKALEKYKEIIHIAATFLVSEEAVHARKKSLGI